MSAPIWFRRAPLIARPSRRRPPLRNQISQNPRAREFRAALQYFGIEASKFAADLGVTRAAVCTTLRKPKTSRRIHQAISEFIDRHHQEILAVHKSTLQTTAAHHPVVEATLQPGFMDRYHKTKVVINTKGLPSLDPEFLSVYQASSNSRREELLQEMLCEYVSSYEDAVRLSFLLRELELSWRAFAIMALVGSVLERPTQAVQP